MRWVACAVFALVASSGCESSSPEPRPSDTAMGATRGHPSAEPESSGVSAPSAATPAPSASASGWPAGAKRVALDAGAMGTSVTVATFTSDQADEASLRPKLERALDEIRRLEGIMTTWREDSEISRVNAAAGHDAVVVGAESLAVIQKSLWISDKSEGVFDISFDAMHGLWKFDEGAVPVIPPVSTIERQRKLIDYRRITVDPAASTVKLEREGMRINLGGIAKGYAVDAAARVLREQGLTSFFVQAGGDLFVEGAKPDGSRYKVGVRDPRGKSATDFFAMIEVQDHAFSTAGDYERSFVKDGKRYHHIIDPRTGFPATASRSVTIWAKDAFLADAIDDAVFILGPEKGLALVDSIDDCGAVIVDEHNKVWISKRLDGLVHVLREPTDGI
jgi:thiamine biosynthesis lipoprotein